MDEFDEWLDGVRRWFYGGEPGADDLPLDGDVSAQCAPDHAKPPVRGGIVIRRSHADTLPDR